MFRRTLLQITTLLVLGIVFVHSFPIRRDSTPSSQSSEMVTMSYAAWDVLTDVYGTIGLYGISKEAFYLKSDELLKPEYRRLERKICMGRIFQGVFSHNVKCENDKATSNLTYSQLTNYYNVLVLHLKLAEHNLNSAIYLEVKDKNKTESLKREEKIVKLLNESVLPALELTLNITNTDCSATQVLANWVISLYSNCTAVQTSNKFLNDTVEVLSDVLNESDKVKVREPDVEKDKAIKTAMKNTARSDKEWCIVPQL